MLSLQEIKLQKYQGASPQKIKLPADFLFSLTLGENIYSQWMNFRLWRRLKKSWQAHGEEISTSASTSCDRKALVTSRVTLKFYRNVFFEAFWLWCQVQLCDRRGTATPFWRLGSGLHVLLCSASFTNWQEFVTLNFGRFSQCRVPKSCVVQSFLFPQKTFSPLLEGAIQQQHANYQAFPQHSRYMTQYWTIFSKRIAPGSSFNHWEQSWASSWNRIWFSKEWFQ